MENQPKSAVEVVCPHCQSVLKVDPASGEVLLSRKHEKREVESFDSALQNAREWEKKKGDLFEQAFEVERKRKDLLEKKFQEAQKSSSADPERPFKPIDLD